MKRFLFAMVVAVGVVLAAEKKASAWCNFNFGAGLNMSFQEGSKKFGRGAFASEPWPYCPPQCDPMMMPPADPKPLEEPKPTPKAWLDNAQPRPIEQAQYYYTQPYQVYQLYQNYQGYQGYAAPGYWYEQ
jgi:hypothetical protein